MPNYIFYNLGDDEAGLVAANLHKRPWECTDVHVKTEFPFFEDCYNDENTYVFLNLIPPVPYIARIISNLKKPALFLVATSKIVNTTNLTLLKEMGCFVVVEEQPLQQIVMDFFFGVFPDFKPAHTHSVDDISKNWIKLENPPKFFPATVWERSCAEEATQE